MENIMRIRKFHSLISKHSLRRVVAKASLGIASLLISFELGMGMMTGYLAAKFFAGPRVNTRGRLPSAIFKLGRYKVHVHHWLFSFCILMTTATFHIFVITPEVFYGFLGGVAVQGILNYQDWNKIITRQ